jgi:putative chitinase
MLHTFHAAVIKMPFDRKIYFDSVRALFGSAMDQRQVDGQNAILERWEAEPEPWGWDRRWLGYALATTKHETASTMQPIEEYGKGAGHPYGVPDSQTKQTYYGRGFVQLTWRDNYAKATNELKLSDENDLEWHAEKALDTDIAAQVMFQGMYEGWFRSPHKFSKYFNSSTDDPYGAREIINGDKHIIPDWSGGVSIGNLIKDYYMAFTAALNKSYVKELVPMPVPEPEAMVVKVIVPKGVKVEVVHS